MSPTCPCPSGGASEAVGGEVGGLVLGLDSCEEEVLQSPAADSYLRLGLVEQRESDPASLVEIRPGQPDDLVHTGAAYLDGGELNYGDQEAAVVEDCPGAF